MRSFHVDTPFTVAAFVQLNPEIDSFDVVLTRMLHSSLLNAVRSCLNSRDSCSFDCSRVDSLGHASNRACVIETLNSLKVSREILARVG